MWWDIFQNLCYQRDRTVAYTSWVFQRSVSTGGFCKPSLGIIHHKWLGLFRYQLNMQYMSPYNAAAMIGTIYFYYLLKRKNLIVSYFRTWFRLYRSHYNYINTIMTTPKRSEPSSRIFLIGEQPNPWDLLQPQDKMSRHRGAELHRRYGRLGGTSLLSPW